jgi:hypothetical protein
MLSMTGSEKARVLPDAVGVVMMTLSPPRRRLIVSHWWE